MEVSMNISKTFEAARPRPEPPQIRDMQAFIITHNYMAYLTPTCNQQAYLPLYLFGDSAYLPGQFTGDDLMIGYSTDV